MLTKVFKHAGKYKVLTILATVMVILAVVAQILPYFFVSQLITPLIKGDSLEKDFIISRIIIIGILLVLNFLLYLGGLSLSHIAAFNTLRKLRGTVQKKMEGLPLGTIQDKGTGRLKKMFVDDIESLEILLAHATPEGLGNIFVPIGVFVSLFVIDWKLALLTIAALPLGIIAMNIMMKQGTSKMNAYYAAAQKMNNTIIEYVNGMEVVKIFNKDSESYKQYKTDIMNYRNFTLDWFKVCWPWMAIYSGIFACTVIFVYPFGGIFAVNGITTLSKFIISICLALGVGGPILKSMHFIPSLLQVARKIEEIEKTVDSSSLVTNNNQFTGIDNTVEYKNVHFAYENTDVISDISLVAKEGEKTAFVGESGSGKSTLAKLLVHYYDISKGGISIGGQDITDMSLEALNERVSYVSQEQFLFNTSIYENIKVGKPNASEAEVLMAAEKAQCNEFIDRLENGIHTLAGDCGNQLSGGERQRVSLARAILKDAPIVVLDEATAFADPENEDKMEAAIAKIVEGKTLIVIAHRLASIKNADKIYVLNKGKIDACGKHNDLLKNSKLYKHLWEASIGGAEWTVTEKRSDTND